MAKNDSVNTGDPIVLYHKKYGFVRAWAEEDNDFMPGSSSSFKVSVNSTALPDINAMTINTNGWDTYKEDDPALQKLLLTQFVKYDSER